jgi:peptidoglycan hydrolase CwlO-like protein
MNKIITIAISSVVGLALPVIGLTISPTRDILLGLPPDEAVLALADKIDESRVDNENKIQELQSIIDNQSIELTNYREQVEEQNNEIENVNTSVKNTNETIEKQKDCNVDISK